MSDKFNISSGNQSSLDTLNIENGSVKFTKDTKSLYIDIDGKRTMVSDFIVVSTKSALDDILAPISNKFYYVESENKMYKYINGTWKAIGGESGAKILYNSESDPPEFGDEDFLWISTV